MNLSTQQIKTFVTLMEEQNFSRVAKILRVSQPTITMRLKMLEQSLGTSLIKREQQSILLTPSGEVAFQYMKRILGQFQEGKDHLSSFPASGRRLSISAIPSFCTYVFPKMLTNDRMDKGVDLTIHNARSADVLQSVLDGISQFGILRGPVQHPDIESVLLYKEKVLLALPMNHLLNQVENLTVTTLLNKSFIIYKRRFWHSIQTRFLEAGGELMTKMKVDSEITAKKLVMSGLGISFLPELSIRREIQQRHIAARSIMECDIHRDAFLIYHRGTDKKEADVFYKWVQASVSPK